MIDQKKINAYMDLVNVIVKKAGDKWAIDSADSGPDSFSTDEELMEYINYELREIEAIYTANGELDDLQKIYEENGLELNSKKEEQAMLSYKNHTITTDGDKIIIDGEAVKVIENSEYTYKINKTCISAQGGAQGLYNFLEDLIKEDFARCWTEAVITGAAKISARRVAR